MSTEPRRFPRWVYGSGADPDPRFSLANERTFLAWLRTSLALATVAVALDVATSASGLPRPVAVMTGLGLLAGGIAVVAWVRWARVERALRRDDPLPGPALVGGVAIVAVLAVSGLALTAAQR